jgi:two-component system, LytTR family, sensor kinase
MVHWQDWAINLGIGLLSSWLIIEVSLGIADGLERRLPWSDVPFARFIVQTTLILLANAILYWLQDHLYTIIYPETLTPLESLLVWQSFIANLLVALMVSALHTGYSLLKRWQRTLEEAADLKVKTLELEAVALQAELQSLKLQLDPHFMFNNFSTLSELIVEDSAKASLFLDNLAKVYRYLIQNVRQDVVLLKEELAFAKAYQYLIHIRHGEQVQIRLDLPDEILGKWLPPITLQLLLENAIKHNRATRAQPLIIHIQQVGAAIKVSNNRQPFPTPLPSTGLGLENIKNRYRILSSQVPDIGSSSEAFWVILPLLEHPVYNQTS